MSEAKSQVSFPKIEERVLQKWKHEDIFKKSVDPKKKAFSFYDGPPFATGLPHYGHLLASTLKDIVPRYWTMKGFRVPRRWGWDCHGLPIEQEIDKKFQFKSSQDIEEFGIAKYNEECRKIVLRFATEWEEVITRLGRWCDFENDYKTMDLEFMESVWWIFNELWKKDLIYRDFRVMPFSTALGTPLSNFEATSNYQEVQDPAITVSFPLSSEPTTKILAWTTTPWTLPANLLLLVHREIDYARVKAGDETYILASERVEAHFKGIEHEILETLKGADLIGQSYQPLFDFFADRPAPHFSIQHSDHVTTESGTGVVHAAPAHGEEDYVAAKPLDIEVICPVSASGVFDERVGPYAGLYVKDADKKIIADLKNKNRLFKQDTYHHRYAFCPRTDTPLISRTVAAWFVKVEAVKDRLIKNNLEQTHWVPEHLREGRFGKWLEGARDWNISRNRFWGNPLPIFEAFEEPLETREAFCVGSINELQELTGKKFTDLHREHLDDLIIEKDGKKFRRVPEVLDCWFESGSMPYAQTHYPFKDKKKTEEEFPADFIGEGLDQTRGWFYTLSVLGTILFDKIPFKNVVVNGLILAEDGKKMSKRLKNYPDPSKVMEKYGADALRLYLIDSPVLRGEELRFSEKGVQEIVRRVLLKLWNAYSFFQSYAEIDQYEASEWSKPPRSDNILDRWIVSRLQSLLAQVEEQMKEYHLFRVVPEILLFIEELTNTYIRLNRSRFWDEGFTDDKKQAFDTLHYTLTEFSKVLAPFAPFVTEEIYGLLTGEKSKESVHLDDYPTADASLIDHKLEEGVALLEQVIELSRSLREREKIKVKIPLKKLSVVHRKQSALEALNPLEDYLKTELNVRSLEYLSNEEDFVEVQIRPNGASLGPRAGKRMKEISKACSQLSFDQLQELDAGQSITVCSDFELVSDDVKVFRNPKKTDQPISASSKVTVALDATIDRDQELEGLAREVVNRVQKLRKDSGLQLDNRIELQLKTDSDLKEAVVSFEKYISEQTLSVKVEQVSELSLGHQGQFEVDGTPLEIALEKVS